MSTSPPEAVSISDILPPEAVVVPLHAESKQEAIDALVTKGSFPALMLSPINFEVLYQQQKQAMAQQSTSNGSGNEAEGTEPPAPESE